jgi:hypothetical protein
VSSREQLEELVVEFLLSKVDITPPKHSSWRRKITALVERVRDTLRAHPQVVPLTLPHRLTSAKGLRLNETVLGILAQAGFTIRQRDVASRTLIIYLIGSLQFEHFGQLSGAASAMMAKLSRHEYPLITENVRQVGRMTQKEEFRRGLAIVLDGLEASLR